jgi:hypothetical protein
VVEGRSAAFYTDGGIIRAPFLLLLGPPTRVRWGNGPADISGRPVDLARDEVWKPQKDIQVDTGRAVRQFAVPKTKTKKQNKKAQRTTSYHTPSHHPPY